MAELNVHLNLTLSSRGARLLMIGAMFVSAVPELASESVTLTTYYPAPSGVYTQMITTGNTYLARDGAATTMVGVGTATPAFKLDVAGTFHSTGLSQFDQGITGAYGILPAYTPWATWGTGAGGAAIYNDNVTYQKLMVVGNNSAAGLREVGVWDNLTVYGNVTMSGALNTPYVSPTDTNCQEINYNINGFTLCPLPNSYATATSGVIADLTVMPIYESGSSLTQGAMFCCACPGGVCPLLP